MPTMLVHHVAISIAFSVVQFLAVILTFFRLGFRLKIQRLWWEDMWAAVAALCTVISVVTLLGVTWTHNHEAILVAGKIKTCMFASVIWSVRMSLIFAIIRITYPAFLRRVASVVAVFFLLFWATTIALEIWWCTVNRRTFPDSAPGHPHCVIPHSIVIFEVAANCTADMASVIFPLRLLWRVKLPPRQRRMILSLFTTSRFLCGFSLAHSVSQLVAPPGIQILLAHVQLAAFMIICNLLVVITYIFRVFQGRLDETISSVSDPSEDDDFTTRDPRSESTRDLTTVDLGSPHPSLSMTDCGYSVGLYPSSTACSTKPGESGW